MKPEQVKELARSIAQTMQSDGLIKPENASYVISRIEPLLEQAEREAAGQGFAIMKLGPDCCIKHAAKFQVEWTEDRPSGRAKVSMCIACNYEALAPRPEASTRETAMRIGDYLMGQNMLDVPIVTALPVIEAALAAQPEQEK